MTLHGLLIKYNTMIIKYGSVEVQCSIVYMFVYLCAYAMCILYVYMVLVKIFVHVWLCNDKTYNIILKDSWSGTHEIDATLQT